MVYSFSSNSTATLVEIPIFLRATGEYMVMAQVLDPLSQDDDRICCCYFNSTSQVQIARISNVDNWYFERVVFPGQRLMFEAPIHGSLEIHTGILASSILSDRIACEQLIVMADESN